MKVTEPGSSVSGAGDINSDGIDDIIIGAPGANQSSVVFGTPSGFPSSVDLASLAGTDGFRILGIDNLDYAGFAVSGAGDVNGDGIDDIVIGAYNARSEYSGATRAGESYVIFGSAETFEPSLELTKLDGTNGFRIDSVDRFDASGYSVSGAGDINSDGIGDLVIGAPFAEGGGFGRGESYIIFGRGSGFESSVALSDLDGTDGFRIQGVNRLDWSGFSVSGAGDINADGIEDLVVGARNGNNGSGETYILFGRTASFGPSLALSTLDDTEGVRIAGIESDSLRSISVSGAGDINADGIDDLAIGAGGSDALGRENAGESYIVFGRSGGFGSSFALPELDGTNGFRVAGSAVGDDSGWSIAGAGDFNGDGIDDLVIGAPQNGSLTRQSDGDESGESYIVFGRAGAFDSTIDLSTLDATNGFRLPGIDAGGFSGTSVAGAGDVNGDGFDDVIIGAPGPNSGAAHSADGPFLAGESYVVFGRRFDDEPQPPQPATWTLTPTSIRVPETREAVTFELGRSPATTSQTVYVSTTQDQGFVNGLDYGDPDSPGVFEGLLNQPIEVAAGEATADIEIAINDDAEVEGDETFGLIVQADPSDPIDTNLAATTFTIEDDDSEPANAAPTASAEGNGAFTLAPGRKPAARRSLRLGRSGRQRRRRRLRGAGSQRRRWLSHRSRRPAVG